jgi:hypothetical protein
MLFLHGGMRQAHGWFWAFCVTEHGGGLGYARRPNAPVLARVSVI